MWIPYTTQKCAPYRMFLLAIALAILLCCVLISIVDHWAKPRVNMVNAKRIGEIKQERPLVSSELVNSSNATKSVDEMWEAEYNARVERVRSICEKDEIAMLRRVWRVAANRRWKKKVFCKTRLCPIIIDEPRVLFFCFIPKVASTRIKQFFLNISNIPVNETIASNSTALHVVANNMLHRVSPMYYPVTTARRFYKMLFVRHPFDRLVSVFRSKAEAPREEVRYFYDHFWNPIMSKTRPNTTIDESSQITFPEFIWYLTHSLERDYDEHWAPYWSRCDPCLVDYDFIGKLETGAHDFQYAFSKVGIQSSPEWWNETPTERTITMKYFSQIPEKYIRELYKIYRLDFELFGYTLDGFVKKS